MKATTLLLRQHKRLQQLATALAHERHHRHALLHELVEDLLAHLVVEEAVLSWLSVRDGDELPSDGQHQRDIRGAILSLMRTPVDDPEFESAVRDLEVALEAHAEVEEREVVPSLERTFTPEELESLGRRMEEYLSACSSDL